MTSKEQSGLDELNRIIDRMGPVGEMDPIREYPYNLTAALEVIRLLRKQIAEMENTSEELTDG